jgi:hypothetical protein
MGLAPIDAMTERLACTDFVAEWEDRHTGEIGGSRTRFQKQTEHAVTFGAAFESSSHFIEILAWDWADCLDIQILEVSTGEAVFIECGNCDGLEGVIARLDRFLIKLRAIADLPLKAFLDAGPIH